MIKTIIKPGLSLSALLMFMNAAANAASISYYLDQNNEGLTPDNYVQVTISDSTSVVGDIDFSVQTLSAFDSLNPGSNFGLSSFGFNYDLSSFSLTDSNIINLSPGDWLIQTNTRQDGFGRFDIVTNGDGTSRTPLLNFTITGINTDDLWDYASVYSSNNAGQGNQLFAAHVAGFDNGSGVTSAYFAGSTPVPVPAAVWLFGSGLIFLSGLLKSRKPWRQP